MVRKLGSSKSSPANPGAVSDSYFGRPSSVDHGHQFVESPVLFPPAAGWITWPLVAPAIVYQIGTLVKLEGLLQCTVAGSLTLGTVPNPFWFDPAIGTIYFSGAGPYGASLGLVQIQMTAAGVLTTNTAPAVGDYLCLSGMSYIKR